MKQLARRDALQAVVGLASAAAVGTAAGRLGSAASTTALDVVPQTSDALVYADTDTLRRDDGLRTLTTAALQQHAQYTAGEDAGRPRDVDELLSDLEADFERDPETVHRATIFGDVGSEELFSGYAGVVFAAELRAEDVKSGIKNMDDVEFTELRASGTVVYEPDAEDGPWVGALGPDRVVVGTEAAVADVVDVANGETSAIGEPVRGAYEDSREAPVRFASRLPDPTDNEGVPARLDRSGRGSVDLTPLDHTTTLAGAVYRDGDVRGLETTLDAADDAAASDVASVVRELREYTQSKLRDDAVADIVGDITVERDGATVTTSVSRTVSELASLVEQK